MGNLVLMKENTSGCTCCEFIEASLHSPSLWHGAHGNREVGMGPIIRVVS